ncbi:MAG TPA: RNA 2',3'-cyclic phosphodiesterase [Solirubrobacteraceae bacterium]|nr:RNA 2',3'-cyclic phosphodiesterase [Solirubrobacteraceae bacterium]
MRLFVALALEAEARAVLHRWAAEAVAGDEALRAVPRDSLHVTLAFLGERPAGEVAEIVRALAHLPPSPPSLAIAGSAWLPDRGRPTVLVAEIEPDPALAALRAAAVERMRPFHEPDERPFRPHVTLARVRRGRRPHGAPPPLPPLRVATAGMALYRSHPGSRYERLA